MATVCLLLLLMFFQTALMRRGCDWKESIQYYQDCFIFFDKKVNWEDAGIYCERWYRGTLVMEVGPNMLTWFREKGYEIFREYRYYWIGAKYSPKYKRWRYCNNVTANLTTSWDRGQPDNYKGNEMCAHIRAQNKFLNDANCEEKFNFICQERKYFLFYGDY
ncbi:C-type lectin-like [Physella acuta]|uniref:C-type lectin-like n=1 Tax=Physella acuta TaxID=109671 RepID=UPI0027DCBE20|nr:C-type lectin-like [Physella acuta]